MTDDARDVSRPRRALRSIAQAIFCAVGMLALTFGAIASASAQSIPPPATHNQIDSNGVDLIRGALFLHSPTASVGQPGAGGLVYQRTYDSSIQAWRDNVTGTINADGDDYTVTLLGVSETFTLDGGVFTSNEGRGGTLTFDSGTNVYTYVTASGVVALYAKALQSMAPTEANEGRVTQMTLPSGEALVFTYTHLTDGVDFSAHRLQSVNNNLGYQLSFEYQSNSPDASGLILVEVAAINNAVEYCAPTANGCSLSGAWLRLQFGYGSGYETVTDALGRTMRYAISAGRITGVRWPSGASDDITIAYDGEGRVESIDNGVGEWSYMYADTGAVRLTTIVDPASRVWRYFSNLEIGRIIAFQDGLDNATQYVYDAFGRLLTIVYPLENYTRFLTDARGNVTQIREFQNAIGGVPGGAVTVYAASYPETCANVVTCNLPTSTTDALGNTTDYAYDAAHGGLLSVTAPDPDGAGPLPRPQTRYSYAQLSASYIQSGGGSPVAAPSAVYRLTAISACATTSSCANGADETRTTIAYGTNNLLPTVITTGAGDGSLSAAEITTYSDIGDVVTVDGPLSGSGDVTRSVYDAARQRVGLIGPDPDGAGSLKNRALRFTYDADGQVTAVDRGTTDSGTDWGSFVALETLSIGYDSVGRRTRESLVVGGVTYALIQYGYDNANNLECTAVRMNMTPSVLADLPGACTLSTEGANGPDRIRRNVYDAAGRLYQVQSAYGTALQQVTLTQTYTANGMLATLTDANGTVTAYEYDGIDRLTKIRFPNASGGGTSTTDYEQFTYNNNRLVTERRLRDGTTVAITYDNLSRVTLVDAPAGTPDITSAYDNFSRLTQVAYTGTHSLAFSYDQLSRNISVTRTADGETHTIGYQYDLSGRRTRITWPDGFYAQYDYDLANATTAIRENGATSGIGVLASYTYDNLGRRTNVVRGNGVTSSYSYDSASQLSGLQQDLSGSGDDLTLGFTYNAAGQAIERTGMTGAYAWPQPAVAAEAYTANGRNQYTAVGAASFSYDARGNLTAAASTTYGYDAFNRLVSAGSATLSYDPAGRLYQVTGTSTTRFLYDELNVIAEYNSSGALMRRYVQGPDLDEPIVWYEGSGTSDRRWLVADQLGSVVAATDASGALIGSPNTYDEYGRPGASNAGRFQFSGQMWISEASVYHYKARAYDPAIGRFLQTDPILYAGGPNLYAYVGNDPVNFVDPLGLQPNPRDVIDVTAGCPATDNCFDSPFNAAPFGGTRGANVIPRKRGEPTEGYVPRSYLSDEIVVTATPVDVDAFSIYGPNPFGLTPEEAYWLDPRGIQRYWGWTPIQEHSVDALLRGIENGVPVVSEPYDNYPSETGARLPDRFAPYIRIVVSWPGMSRSQNVVRVIIGATGALFVTNNHYRSFIPVERQGWWGGP